MKALCIILLTLLIFQIINCKENREFYRCGVDDEEIIPLPATDIVKEKDNRRLDDGDFGDFNIYLDLINIKKDIIKFHLEEYQELFIDSLNKAVETLESLLKVKKYDYGFKFNDEQMRNILIEDWNKTIIGSNAIGNSKKLGIDLFIFGRFDDHMDEYTLASAGPRYVDPETHQPIVGVVNINTNVNYSKIHSKEYFQSIIIHEFTHILGFLKSYFTAYYHNIFNRTDEYGLIRYYINSTKVLNVAKKYFNCSNIDGVELEESGGTGTAGSHWEARILLGEYMNGVVYPEEQVISEFTLALLEDSGYYKANYYTGGLMRFGKGKGCDFIKKKCVDSNHEINPFFENEFSSYYQYFSNERYGGFSPADFCPVSMAYPDESENAYYTGQCSFKGNGGYGTRIIYNETQKITINETHYQIKSSNVYYTSEMLKLTLGETYSDHSFCYQSSLVKNNSNFYSDVVRAICFESFCSDYSLTIKINEDYIVCPRAGGKIEVEGYKGFFLCPDYNLICSGTVICNDMFDCVDKKSEAKEESYIYDYSIKTSQNIENAEISEADNKNNYEIGDNGICPKNCKHCHEGNICLKCRNDYGFVGSKDNQEIKCLSQSELNKGYYKENNIYYKCIANCDICSNSESCQTCSEGFDSVNGKCIKQINNCKEYGNDGFCSKCKDNFAFQEDNRNSCLSKDNFNNNNYYTKDEGISYYPCGKSISECSQCYYDGNDDKVKCYLCNNNHVLFDEENSCLDKNKLKKEFYYINDTHINKCSNVINNCNECDNNATCSKCIDNFYMVNDDKNKCLYVSLIKTNEYYLNEEKTIYYSCNNALYQNIHKCKTCTSKNNCTLCQDDFTFVNGNKTICIDKNTLKDKYIQDPSDKSNFIKCENKYNNCDSCTNKQCSSCKNDYIFINDNYTQCVLKSSLNLEFYFTNDNITYYSCKEEKYKNKEECQTLNPERTVIEIPKELTNSTISKDDDNKPLFEIFILQVQIINKLLKVFITLSKKIEKNFHIKFSVDLYKRNNKMRNLQETLYQDYEVDLYLNNANDIEAGNIISLTSEEEFNENDRIVVNEKPNEDYEMKVLNNDNKILDTQENKKKIENKEIMDFSKVPSEFTKNEYYIESSSKGCQFDLTSKNKIKENIQNIDLTFIEKDNKDNNSIKAKCTLSSENEKNIPCTLEQELEGKNYILDSYVGSNEKGLFYIIQDKDGFQLSCSEEKSGKSYTGIIIGVVVAAVVIIVTIVILVVCLKKKKEPKIETSEMNNMKKEPKIISFSNNNNISSLRAINIKK